MVVVVVVVVVVVMVVRAIRIRAEDTRRRFELREIRAGARRAPPLFATRDGLSSMQGPLVKIPMAVDIIPHGSATHLGRKPMPQRRKIGASAARAIREVDEY